MLSIIQETSEGLWYFICCNLTTFTTSASSLDNSEVTIVFDHCDVPNSTKNQERSHCVAESLFVHVILVNRTVPHYQNVLKNLSNKASLAFFICTYLTEHVPTKLKDGQVVALAWAFADCQRVLIIASHNYHWCASIVLVLRTRFLIIPYICLNQVIASSSM